MTTHVSASIVDHLVSRAGVIEEREARRGRLVGLTSRDIEDEALVRLARKGYDWSNALGRRRNAA